MHFSRPVGLKLGPWIRGSLSAVDANTWPLAFGLTHRAPEGF